MRLGTSVVRRLLGPSPALMSNESDGSNLNDWIQLNITFFFFYRLFSWEMPCSAIGIVANRFSCLLGSSDDASKDVADD